VLLKNILFLFIFLLSLLNSLFAQNNYNLLKEKYRLNSQDQVYQVSPYRFHVYKKPGNFDFLLNAPADLANYTRDSFLDTSPVNFAGMMAVTAIMVYYDQQLIDAAHNMGDRWGISNTTSMKTWFKVFDFPIQYPWDLGTGLYFIGDGWTHMSIAAGFLGFGLIKDDNRALQTASQIAEGMVTTAFVIQLLKHVTGRQSPFASTADGGLWRPFPDQVEYHKHVPRYDAYPSGHLATAMMTLTVIAENYPEYKYIRPLGYTLMTILSWQMMNNGVHWISDYPLALAIGYSLAHIAIARGRRVVEVNENGILLKNKNNFSCQIVPVILPQGGVGMGLVYRF